MDPFQGAGLHGSNEGVWLIRGRKPQHQLASSPRWVGGQLPTRVLPV